MLIDQKVTNNISTSLEKLYGFIPSNLKKQKNDSSVSYCYKVPMKKSALIILVLFNSICFAEPKLTGLWEGFADRGSMIGAHVLEINQDGKGFYAYTIGDSLDENFVFTFDISKTEYENGYLSIPLKSKKLKPEFGNHLIISPDLGNSLNVFTLFH